jgi:hypothetical protein
MIIIFITLYHNVSKFSHLCSITMQSTDRADGKVPRPPSEFIEFGLKFLWQGDLNGYCTVTTFSNELNQKRNKGAWNEYHAVTKHNGKGKHNVKFICHNAKYSPFFAYEERMVKGEKLTCVCAKIRFEATFEQAKVTTDSSPTMAIPLKPVAITRKALPSINDLFAFEPNITQQSIFDAMRGNDLSNFRGNDLQYRLRKEHLQGLYFNNYQTLVKIGVEAARKMFLDNYNGDVKEMAKQEETTTTCVGMALLGEEAIKNVKEGTYAPPSHVEESIVQQVKASAENDIFVGYKVRSESEAHMTVRGHMSEGVLENMLISTGIQRSDFKTGYQLKEARENSLQKDEKFGGAVDILFDTPQIINGRSIKWIECKALIVPELSNEDKVNALVKQIQKYTESYGEGAIYWYKHGFSQSIADIFNKAGINVVHMTDIKNRPKIVPVQGVAQTVYPMYPSGVRTSNGSRFQSHTDIYAMLPVQTISQTPYLVRNTTSEARSMRPMQMLPSSGKVLGGEDTSVKSLDEMRAARLVRLGNL